MKLSDINIRDPFILPADGRYYLYGTRARDFGMRTGGFDVYISADLDEWSDPLPCFSSADFGLNRGVNWAPEVHFYRGAYYMFATFTKENGLRGTYALISERPEGPFRPHSAGALTPYAWECLDGTLYVSPAGAPYLVYCHEHTQIIDGTVEYMPLREDLTAAAGESRTLFHGSSPWYVDPLPAGEHYVTDGPFLYRTTGGALLLIWSTILRGRYAQCAARAESGDIAGPFEHLPSLVTDDGGHGMIFTAGGRLNLTWHSPNNTGSERPHIRALRDTGDGVALI